MHLGQNFDDSKGALLINDRPGLTRENAATDLSYTTPWDTIIAIGIEPGRPKLGGSIILPDEQVLHIGNPDNCDREME